MRPFLFLLFVFTTGLASSADALPESVPLSDEATISVITVLPGTEIHALFGHTAIRVFDPSTGLDAVYNYGTFDFSDPLFVPRFIHGQMDYVLSVHGFRSAVEYYRDRERRPVIVQELNLEPHEVQDVYDRLRINALPENREYRYDFFFDNCSTRPRDVIEETLGRKLSYRDDTFAEQSFRDMLAPYLAGQPFLRAGINVLLGSPADRIATTRETMFLPIDLFERLESAQLQRDDGHVPLVARTDTAAWVDGYETRPTSLPWATILTVLLLVGGCMLAWREIFNGKPSPVIYDAIVFTFVGLIGLLIIYMWLISEHTVLGPNWNLLWAWPTHLIAAYMLQRGRINRVLRIYLAASAAASAVVALLWFIWPQALPFAFLPLVLHLAIRSLVLWKRLRLES